MAADRYDPQRLETLAALVEDVPGVKRGLTFGQPSYSIGGRVFASVYQDGLVIKLPAARIQPLLDGQTYQLFEPMADRPAMKEWLHIRRPAAQDHQQDEQLVHEALEFVASQPEKKPRKRKS